jgi:hypothetical protein
LKIARRRNLLSFRSMGTISAVASDGKNAVEVSEFGVQSSEFKN